MSSMNIVAGDKLRCMNCGHEKLLTCLGLRELVSKHFSGRKGETLYTSELAKFKCSVCGAKQTKLIEDNVSTSPAKITQPSGMQFENCRQCGGDGGAGGRCPRCGGNGFEPK
jgi:hypothetical protein